MSEVPKFFVPNVEPEKQEEFYSQHVERFDGAASRLDERIYSISFHHDSELWIATVGQPLKGERYVWKGRKRTEHTTPIEDSALVLAIFPKKNAEKDRLHIVVTDCGNGQNRVSHFACPFLARAGGIEYFAMR